MATGWICLSLTLNQLRQHKEHKSHDIVILLELKRKKGPTNLSLFVSYA